MRTEVRILSKFHPPPRDHLGLGWRLLVYLSLWALVALAFQLFLQPESAGASTASPLQQRIAWVHLTPVMAVLGLQQLLASLGHFPGWVSLVIAGAFLLLAILTLTRVRRAPFITLILLQALLLAAAAVSFIRHPYPPGGG